MDVDFIKVSEMVEDFESLIDFAAYCGFGRNFLVSEPEEFALRRLAPLRLKAKIELFAPGAMQTRWSQAKGAGFCIGELAGGRSKPFWTVAVEENEGEENLITGILVHELGHYVEQIASGPGLKGRYEMRGTSYDQACYFLSALGGISIDDQSVRTAADELSANLNAAWICWASGTDPSHAAIEMIANVTNPGMYLNGRALESYAFEISKAVMHPAFYNRYIGCIGWTSEREMCRLMDVATSRLIIRLCDDVYKKDRMAYLHSVK